jgi:hypothetical protein
MLKRGYLQISFGWMFAIIVGIFILFLAIFLATRIISTEEASLDATTTKKIEILLNPLETSFGEEKTNTLTLPSGTRINNKCDNGGSFGNQWISISQKVFGKYSETGVNVNFENKYIFSDEYVEGKKFYLHSRTFEIPFKVADLIFLTSEEYCFLDVPEEIINGIPLQDNIITDREKCQPKSIMVCFAGGSNCDITVNYGRGYVEKNNERLYFSGNLLYGAIFSSPEIYECQIKRLMQRTQHLALLYYDKSYFISEKCQTDFKEDLLALGNDAKTFEDSSDLDRIYLLSETILEKNERGECQLW